MELYAYYLRDQASAFRDAAQAAPRKEDEAELLALAQVCDEVAETVEDRLSGG